jgi:hypothetical protein
MTIADEARANSISCEMVKYAYRQTRDGIVVSFVVHPNDIPAALSTSHIGSRYVAVLVQIGDDEKPIPLEPAKEKAKPEVSPKPSLANGKPSEKARRDWRDVQPAAQAGIRCGEPIFWAFINENYSSGPSNKVTDAETAAEAVRVICDVHSRVGFGTDHRKRILWHQLDTEYQAWLLKERIGA